MSTGSLTGKVALITGASSGIGAATARVFAAAGAKLVLHGRDPAKLQAVVDGITKSGGSVVHLAGDIGQESVTQSLVELALKTYGKLNIVFLNAGLLIFNKLVDIKQEDVDSQYNTNVKGVLWGLKHSLPALAKSSSDADWNNIVINSSTVANHVIAGAIGGAVYASTKAAVDLLVRHAAVEGAPLRVRVNSVNPGMTTSEGVLTLFGGADVHAQRTAATTLVPAAASTTEIAEFVKFIAENRTGRFINGSNLLIDGGYALK